VIRPYCFVFIVFVLSICCPRHIAASDVINNPLEITMTAFRSVDCMDDKRYAYHKDTIRALSYTKMRALRAFCDLPEIYAEEAIETLQRLVFYQVSFDQVRFLESFAELDGVTGALCWKLLDITAGLEFTAIQAISMLPKIAGMDAATALRLVTETNALDDYGRWTAAALFSVNGLDRRQATAGLIRIRSMNTQQKLSAEQACKIADIESGTAMNMLTAISLLPPAQAINSRGLFSADDMNAERAWFWLQHYFSLPTGKLEAQFYVLENSRRTTLLDAFASASDYHIRTINDLHAVTDRYGAEIGTGTLATGGFTFITEHFDKLHPKARGRFTKALHDAVAANEVYTAINVLRQATSFARKETARDLSSPNIYILLSRGSELYDSSFRDILVPVLLTRIKKSFNANLLYFLKQTDPDNNHVSDFIISCAQKGKLTAFFPDNSREQRIVLDLMAKSAFRDEQNLILFSATFSTLLQKLEPGARTYLIEKMIAAVKDPDSTFSLQLRVILQFYGDRHPELLSAADRKLIGELVQRYGTIDLSQWTSTDFSRWKQDGKLSSLSIFQSDDDGKISYLSNSRNLLRNGYRARLPVTISMLSANNPVYREAKQLIARGDTAGLYRLSMQTGLIIEYHKTVNSLELSHAVTVFQNRATQRRLLKQYLVSGMEMFAQRGHSYWREEQILEPMRYLIESGDIAEAAIPDISRFLSIGSCGGIRIYSELNRLFDNSIDIFATVGTGKAIVNDPYNQRLFEIIAASDNNLSWDDVSAQLTPIFADGRGADYLQPGSLPAILHKMMDVRGLN